MSLISVHHALRILRLTDMYELEPNFNERPKVETEDSPVVYRAKVVDAEFVVSACFANNLMWFHYRVSYYINNTLL